MNFLSKPCFLLTLEPASHLTTYVYIRTKYHPMNLVWLSKVYTGGRWDEDGTQHHDSQDLPDAGAPEEADEASFCTISCSLLSPPAVETWARVMCTQQPHPRSLLTLQLRSAMSHRVRQALAHFRLQQAT